jgi:hypothetical protein
MLVYVHCPADDGHNLPRFSVTAVAQEPSSSWSGLVICSFEPCGLPCLGFGGLLSSRSYAVFVMDKAPGGRVGRQFAKSMSVGSLMQGLMEREMHPSSWEMAPAPIPFLRGPRFLKHQDAPGWPLW